MINKIKKSSLKSKEKKQEWLELYVSNGTNLKAITELKICFEEGEIYIKNIQETTEKIPTIGLEQTYHLN